MTEAAEGSTAWKKMLEPEYQGRVRSLDWFGAPGIPAYARELAGCDWLEHARDSYLIPLATKRREASGNPAAGLSMISFGCGASDTEVRCLQYGWPIEKMACLELDRSLLAAGEAKMQPYQLEKTFICSDMNNVDGLNLEPCDVVFFCHSLHHCTNLENFLPFVNRCLKPDGLIVGYDYFGPNRFQLPYEHSKLIKDMHACLPDRLQRNLVTGEVEPTYLPPMFQHIIAHDPSESARSSDLRHLFFGNFPVLEFRPMGGTLLSPLLTLRSGNYETEDDVAILRMMMLIERTLIERGLIQSNDVYFVCQKSLRL